jgi:hypothetical protein
MGPRTRADPPASTGERGVDWAVSYFPRIPHGAALAIGLYLDIIAAVYK